MGATAPVRLAVAALFGTTLLGMRGAPERAAGTFPVCGTAIDQQEPLPRGVSRREGRIVLRRGYEFRQEGPNRVVVGRTRRARAGAGFQVTGVFSCACVSPLPYGSCFVVNTGTELLCRSAGCMGGVCMMITSGTVLGVGERAPARR